MSLDHILLLHGAGEMFAPVDIPTGFDFTPPFTISKSTSNPRKFRTNFDPNAYLVGSAMTYYLAPDGNDSNTGLNAGEAKQSIGELLDVLNADPPAGATLILAPGTYSGTLGTNGKSINFPCNMICESGRAVITNIQTITGWTKEAGFTNLYRSSTVTSNTTSVIDLSDLDSYGIPKRLKVFSTNADADANPGSVRASTSVILVHTFDGRVPDSSIVAFGAISGTIYSQTTGQNLFFKNIDFWGGARPIQVNHAESGNMVFENCSIRYGRTENGFRVEPIATSGLLTICNKTDCAYNGLDGFNYNNNQRAIEIDCKGVWNGYAGAGTGDNGSSAHNLVRSVRVNGIYSYNDDRNLHDVGSTRNWLLGCQAGFAQNGSLDKYDNANFLAGSNAAATAVQTWMDGCTSLGGSASDLGSYSSSIARTRDCVGLNITDGDGTIESY